MPTMPLIPERAARHVVGMRQAAVVARRGAPYAGRLRGGVSGRQWGCEENEAKVDSMPRSSVVNAQSFQVVGR